MIKSMTGYSKEFMEVKGYGFVSFEIKAVNGKNLGLNFRMPQELSLLEQDLRRMICKSVVRGTVNISISVDYSSDFIELFVQERIKKLKGLSSLKDFENFSQLIFSDISNYIPLNRKIDIKSVKGVKDLASLCIKKFDAFRISEGKEIKKDFIKYNSLLEKEIKIIKNISSVSVEKKRKKLFAILGEKNNTFNQEILAYAEKVDISEEISRFSAHLSRLSKGKSGVSMLFILQELNREANTLSAKSEDIRLIQSVLKIKETVEKIKEQTLNVE